MSSRYANSTPYLLKAKWPAQCSCGAQIKVGDEAMWYPQARKLECRECATPTLEALADERDVHQPPLSGRRAGGAGRASHGPCSGGSLGCHAMPPLGLLLVALLLSGWAVGVGDPTGNKAATTAAAVRVEDLVRPLDRRWLARLGGSNVPLPGDAPADAVALAAAAPQFQAAEVVARAR